MDDRELDARLTNIERALSTLLKVMSEDLEDENEEKEQEEQETKITKK